MKPPFPTLNDSIFEHLDSFIIGTPDQLEAAELEPFGVPTRWRIDPTLMRHATFFELLQRLDALTFGTVGMPMEKWIFYDCAELPGFIYGFALRPEDLTPEEVALLGVPAGYEGPVPISMYIAIPMREPGAWFGHNLASLNRLLPHRRLAHLGTLTKAMALRAMRADKNVGVTQWSSAALHIHTKFGPLVLETAWTPVHSYAASLTYAFGVDEPTLRGAMGDPAHALARPEPTRWVDAADTPTLKALQRAIEAGGRVVVTHAPRDLPATDASPARRLVPILGG